MVADRAHPNDLAHNRNVDRFVHALTHDFEPGLGIDRPLHLVHGLLQREPLDRVIIDLGDQVARHDAGFRRRRFIHRSDHLDEAILHHDLDTEPAELAVGGLLHVTPGLLIHVPRMRIERCDHAVDRALDQLGVVGLFNVIGPYPLEHLAKQIELRVGVGTGRSLGHCHQLRSLGPGNEQGQAGSCCRTKEKKEILAHSSRTFSLSVVARHRPVFLPSSTKSSQYLSGFIEAVLPGRGLGAETALGAAAEPIAELRRNITERQLDAQLQRGHREFSGIHQTPVGGEVLHGRILVHRRHHDAVAQLDASDRQHPDISHFLAQRRATR